MRTVSCHHHGAEFSHYSCVLPAQAGMVGGAEYVMAVRQTALVIVVTFCVSCQKCSGTKVLCRIGIPALRLMRLG